MNIFLPYENDVKLSLESLDDLRLKKQILETHQLLNNAMKELNGEEIKGYSHHPVYLFYKDNVKFLSYYGKQACLEYNYRFGKHHTLFYSSLFTNAPSEQPSYTPYYMEGAKTNPNHTRTTENVSYLFQRKLRLKWQLDKKKPSWTGRKMPIF